jgi:hypothetical protein
MPLGLSAGAIAAIGAGVSAAGTVAGSLISANAAKGAASKANAAQTAGLDQARADLEPWRTTGGTANTAATDILGLNGPDAAAAARDRFQTSPGYQWSFDQGLRAVDAGKAAEGMLRSGAAIKAEQTFGTGLADQEFTTYYNRLFDLSKLGEGAAAGQAGFSQNTAQGIAQTDLSEGSALTSIYGNAAKGLGNAAGGYLNNLGYTNALSPPATDSTVINPVDNRPYVTSSDPNQRWQV